MYKPIKLQGYKDAFTIKAKNRRFAVVKKEVDGKNRNMIYITSLTSETGKENTGFGTNFLYYDNVCGTLTTKKDCYCLFDEPRYTSDTEAKKIGSYPQDYNFLDLKPSYLIGMSVPPIMTAQIATEIYKQWLFKL